jgi:hypothetical protein
MTETTQKSTRGPAWTATCAIIAASGLVLSGCGSEGKMSEQPGTPTQALFAFYTDSEGVSQVARIDPVTLQVLETNHNPTSAGGGKQKSYYYEDGYVWTGGGGNVWGMDPKTLEPVQGVGGPYIQANRSGEVGLAQVNTVGASSASGMSIQSTFDSDAYELLQRTSWTDEELAQVDLCTLNHSVRNATRLMAMGR